MATCRGATNELMTHGNVQEILASKETTNLRHPCALGTRAPEPSQWRAPVTIYRRDSGICRALGTFAGRFSGFYPGRRTLPTHLRSNHAGLRNPTAGTSDSSHIWSAPSFITLLKPHDVRQLPNRNTTVKNQLDSIMG